MARTRVGLEGIQRISDFELNQKRVFIRVDFNVPVQDGVITDNTRILAALPTIRYALEHGAKIVLASHFGRPQAGSDRSEYSMEIIARELNRLLSIEVLLVEDPASEAPRGLLQGLQKGQLVLLENLRFEAGETQNSREFAQIMANYTDVYINDAFGASHRAHASIDQLPRCLNDKAAGFLVVQEVEMLDRVARNPQKPFTIILGGAKVSDKIGVVEHLLDSASSIIVGGAMAYTFLQAQGVHVGSSRVEKDRLNFARELIERMQARSKQILLPVDHAIGRALSADTEVQVTAGSTIPEGFMGLDIGPKTLAAFKAEVLRAKTIFWNGPMGVFELAPFSRGSFELAGAMAEACAVGAQAIVGGGDSASAAKHSGFADRLTHISTGGGASLEYLQGDPLPGLEALRGPVRPSAGSLSCA